MIIAQISDLHVTVPGRLAYGSVDTAAALDACVARLAALDPRPDVVLATGDLVEAGDAEEYGLMRELLRPLDAPLFLIPGNHDDRAAMREAFADAPHLRTGAGWIQYTVEDGPVRLIGLDTLVPGAAHGALCAARLAWLEARLAEQPDRPTVVFMHHPPVPTGIVHMDRIGLLEGADGLGHLIARHRNVQRILCGHIHRPIQTLWHGTVVSVAPSPAHQVALELAPDGPAAFVMEPPAFHLHVWDENAGVLVTHHGYVGGYGGLRPFGTGAHDAL